MSDVATGVACSECGRSFRWRAELAGRSVMCKCGQKLRFPASDPAAAVAAPVGTLAALPGLEGLPLNDELLDLAPEPVPAVAPRAAAPVVKVCPKCSASMPPEAVLCTRCGYHTGTGKALGTSVKNAPSAGVQVAAQTGMVILAAGLGFVTMVICVVVWCILPFQLTFLAWVVGVAIGGVQRLVRPYGGLANGLTAAGNALLGLGVIFLLNIVGLAMGAAVHNVNFVAWLAIASVVGILAAFKIANGGGR